MDTQYSAPTDFVERWSELAQGKVNTVGESIVINSEKNTYGYEWSKLFAACTTRNAAIWEALAGDSLFTRSGSRYTANIDLQDMLGSDPDTSTSTIKYTLDTVERFDLRFYIEQLYRTGIRSAITTIAILRQAAQSAALCAPNRSKTRASWCAEDHTYRVSDRYRTDRYSAQGQQNHFVGYGKHLL